ncbi:hypothetical protein NPIL_362141 [Nephila pilipes]|uniref:Uncharacterized protein n=1 Tax=Nephila pilipes TaxID=299642 RepID=A0A8X6T6Y2_NEPPI|nr:hypothetical protein NPIL_362141 [Nephila pilipes]
MFRILRNGKEISVNVDRLKPTYVPKELGDIPAGVRSKEKVSSQPNEVLDAGQENCWWWGLPWFAAVVEEYKKGTERWTNKRRGDETWFTRGRKTADRLVPSPIEVVV